MELRELLTGIHHGLKTEMPYLNRYITASMGRI